MVTLLEARGLNKDYGDTSVLLVHGLPVAQDGRAVEQVL